MTLRKSAAQQGRAPQMMGVQNVEKDPLLDMEFSSNHEITISKIRQKQKGALAPPRTFDEFNDIIFNDQTPSSLKPSGQKVSSADAQPEHKNQKSEKQVVNLSDSNLMLDIDESTPTSQKTQLIYTDRSQVMQTDINFKQKSGDQVSLSQGFAAQLRSEQQILSPIQADTKQRDTSPSSYK